MGDYGVMIMRFLRAIRAQYFVTDLTFHHTVIAPMLRGTLVASRRAVVAYPYVAAIAKQTTFLTHDGIVAEHAIISMQETANFPTSVALHYTGKT